MIYDVLDDIIENKRDLTYEESYECMNDLISGDYPDSGLSCFG